MLASGSRAISTARRGVSSHLSSTSPRQAKIIIHAQVNAHRKFTTTAVKRAQKQKLVILGTGWGAFRLLSDLDFSSYDVTVISPRNHFLFTPLLCSTTTGVLEFRSIMETIRPSNQKYQFYQGHARDIDFDQKKITCSEWIKPERTFEVEYDKLVLSIGADNNTFNIPGVTPKNVWFLKELSDARAIRNRIIDCLEEASIPGISREERQRLLNFVVVGGGPTGVEFAAELSDFFWADVLKYYPNIHVNELKVTLVEAGDTILSAFSKTLVDQAMKNFKRQGIDTRLHTKVKEVQPGKVFLDDGSVLECGLIVWSTGVGPRKLVQDLKDRIELGPGGRILVDDHLRVKSRPEVFAIGDCALIDGNPLQATAQVANQQAQYLAKQLNGKLKKDSSGRDTVRFQYYPLGLMAYIGSYKSVLDSSFFKGSGWLEFLAWRSVYLTRLGSMKSKLMVPYNWLKTLVWGRDVSHF